jgi:hypothetical protein
VANPKDCHIFLRSSRPSLSHCAFFEHIDEACPNFFFFQTFIPQDAALFSGTLRDNLDPFGMRSFFLHAGVLFNSYQANTKTVSA